MAQRGVALLALASLLGVEASQVSPVQKVVQVIDAMASKVQSDLEQTSRTFDLFAKYCDDDATAKDYAIKDSLERIEQVQAVVGQSTAKISSLESTIEDLSGNIAQQQQDMQDGGALREKEHQQFLVSEKTMLAMTGDLSAALKALRQGGVAALTQLTAEKKDNLNKVVASLSQVVESSFVTHADFQKVRAFLQERDDADASLTGAQPEKEDGDGTLAVLGHMEQRSMDTIADMRNKEKEAAHSFLMLKQGSEATIQSLNEEMKDATAEKQSASETLAGAHKDLSGEQKALEEDRNSLTDLKTECQDKATQFETDSKDAKAELGALGKAKAILTQKFSFLQVSSSTKTVSANEGDDSRAQALRQIEQLGRKFHSTVLVTLAYRASESPFGKVRSMVENMIAKLQEQAAEEATQKAFCDKEMSMSQKSKQDKGEKLRKTSARIDKADSAVAKLTEGVQVLSSEIADIDTATAEATAIRGREKVEFLKVQQDYSESEEACSAAIAALREYYEGASFIQESAGSSEAGGSSIIGLLEVAESDFAAMLADARSGEGSAVDDFKKTMQEQRVAKATKNAEVKGKRSQLANLKTSLANYNSDKDGVSTELDAVNAYSDKLKPQCETQTASYGEIKAKRDAEIDGLKDALSTLSGDGLALVQTGHYLRRTHHA